MAYVITILRQDHYEHGYNLLGRSIPLQPLIYELAKYRYIRITFNHNYNKFTNGFYIQPCLIHCALGGHPSEQPHEIVLALLL